MKPFFFSLTYLSFILFLLWGVNFNRKRRYQQWMTPLFALLFSIAAIWVYIKYHLLIFNEIREIYQKLQNTPLNSYLIPYKEEEFPIYYNFLILSLFLIVKSIVHLFAEIFTLLIRFWQWIKKLLFKKDHENSSADKNESGDDGIFYPFLAYFYDKEQKAVFLRDECVYPATFIRYMSRFAFMILVICIIADIKGITEKPVFLPRLPAVPLLILFEIAWYFGGVRLHRKTERTEGELLKGKKEGYCRYLWEKYMKEEGWRERLLAASMNIEKGEANDSIRSNQEAWERGNDLDSELNIQLDVVRKNLSRQGFVLNGSQSEILEILWKGEDVLISEAVYEKASPVIFSALQRDIFEGHKIIFLTPSGISDEFIRWIEKWLNVQIFSGKDYHISGIGKFRGIENLLVTSVRELLKYNMKISQEWFSQVKTVVVIHIPDTIFKDIPSATALFQILADQSEHKLQLIMLTTEERKNMEPSVRECLTSTPHGFHLLSDTPDDLCYMIWRSEGKTSFQSAVLQNTPRYYGAGTVLAVPALRENIERISLINANHEPWQEYVEEMNKINDPGCRRARNAMVFHPIPFISESEDNAFVISYDNDFNLVTALCKALGRGKAGLFLHVITPPYLLRDYFAENIDFFLKRRPESIGTLTPTLMMDPDTVAYYLKERMLVSELTEDEITRHINRIEYDPICEKQAVEERLVNLFYQVFGKDLRDRLEVKSYDELDPERKSFKKVIRLKLKPDIRQALPNIWQNCYSVYDPGKNILEILPGEHIYQNYLPYQVHAFQGNLFKIRAIDNHTRCVITENVTPEGTPIYRHINTVNINKITPYHESIIQTTRKNLEITKSLFMADIEVRTTEYFTFMKGIDFAESPETTNLRQKDIPPRHYDKGRMLSFSVKNRDGSPYPESEKISLTLSLLFNEIFFTLFPETHQYILATACSTAFRRYEADDTIKADEKEILKLVPKCHYPADDKIKVPDKNTVFLFMIEDAATDMGLVKAVYDNWEYIFMIIEDYLTWFLDRKDTEKGFLTFSTKKIPEFLSLEDSRDLLTALVGDRPMNIRKSREIFETGKK